MATTTKPRPRSATNGKKPHVPTKNVLDPRQRSQRIVIRRADVEDTEPVSRPGVEATARLVDGEARITVSIAQSPTDDVLVDLCLTITGPGGKYDGEVIWIDRAPEDVLALAETIRRAWVAAEERNVYQALDTVEVGRVYGRDRVRVKALRRRTAASTSA